MKNQPRAPVKQHTMPNFYLKRFSDTNSMVWVYDREKKELRKQPTKDTTIERDFYTFHTKDGDKNLSIEIDLFAKSIEERANRVIEKLEKGTLPNLPEERRDLCEFVTTQYLRTTAFRRDVSYSYEQFSKIMLRMSFFNEERAQKTIENFERNTGQKFDITPEEAMKFIKEDKYKIEVPKEYHLTFMLESFKEFYGIFFRLNWVFVRSARNNLFLTSDNPFSVMRFGAVPLQPYHISLAELTLPLSSRICLYMHKYGGVTFWQDADDKIINNFNLRTIFFSDRFIISRKRKQLLNLVKKSKIDKMPRKPGIKIESPF
ncbi:MAG: DUF4238 domain-containing protein [Patescibacteria group bacterium]